MVFSFSRVHEEDVGRRREREPAPDPVGAFLATLAAARPDAPTACAAWTAHEVTAHLAAALAEIAELVEDVLNAQPKRPTRGFDEREVPYRALPDQELRQALLQMLTQASTALSALARRGPDTSFEFFGRPFTAAQLQQHAGSESSLHRWDLCGDDEIGDELLSAGHEPDPGVADGGHERVHLAVARPAAGAGAAAR